MTTTSAVTQTSPSTEPSAEDPRAIFARLTGVTGSVIGGIRLDQLDLSTPCDEYTVRELLTHVTSVLNRVSGLGRGETIGQMEPSMATEPQTIAEWEAAWADAVREQQGVWADDAVLERVIVLPWATESGGDTLKGYANELIVHTWDLAQATGQDPTWGDDDIEAAFGAIRKMLPGEGRKELFAAIVAGLPPEAGSPPPPFADRIDVPADAPLIDQLVAWNGRRP